MIPVIVHEAGMVERQILSRLGWLLALALMGSGCDELDPLERGYTPGGVPRRLTIGELDESHGLRSAPIHRTAGIHWSTPCAPAPPWPRW